MDDKRLLFIVNPCAGLKKVEGRLSEILQIFCKSGYLPTVLMTEYAGHATELCAKYGADYDRIVCAGGDGTLNETISGMLKADIDKPVGYLPCGTTNDLGNTLGLSTDLIEAARTAVGGKEFSVDIGEFNGRTFVYTASFGAFTRISYDTPQAFKNVLGHLAYVLEGIGGVFNQLKPTHARISTDAGDFSGDYLLGSVSNTTSLAGIITIDKEKVKLDDGLFELLLVDMPKNALDFSRLVLNVTQKKFGEMLHLHAVKELHIETDENMDWTLDGECAKGETSFDIRNLPRKVRILVPEE